MLALIKFMQTQVTAAKDIDGQQTLDLRGYMDRDCATKIIAAAGLMQASLIKIHQAEHGQFYGKEFARKIGGIKKSLGEFQDSSFAAAIFEQLVGIAGKMQTPPSKITDQVFITNMERLTGERE